MDGIKNRFKYFLLLALFIANFFVWIAVFKEDKAGILSVAFLDVGQGDAIFIDAPNGNQVLLDGGINKNVLRQLADAMPFYDNSIDMVIESHPDSDHIGGLLDVFDKYKINAFVSSGANCINDLCKNLNNKIMAEQSKNIKVKAGSKIDLGDGVYLDIISPPIGGENFKDNDGSIVARLVYGNNSFMLTGDVEKKMEGYLVSAYGEKLKSDVLKVGHHGSHTSTSEAFLGFVGPEYAVISVGANNRYSHPHKETLDLLNKFKIPILRTDELGAIFFESDGEVIVKK